MITTDKRPAMTRRNWDAVMDGDGLTLAVLYRLVYGQCRDRLGEFYREQSPETIRDHTLAGLGTFDPAMTNDPEFTGTVSEAVEDALAGRKPRW
jgi:hypothetical protein